MSKMLPFYESILGAAGLIVTSDGCVSVQTSKEPKPMTLKGKRLVIPTKEHQANPNPDAKISFHPLVENVMRGESEVFERFRLAINSRLNVVIGSIMTMLLTLGTSEAEQHKLTPDQSEFLRKVKNADAGTLERFKKIMDSLPAAAHQKLFVSIFMKRGGTVGDKRYSRVGVVHFPFYNDLKKSDGELHGVKLRVKDREAIAGLLDYILPEQDIAGVYNRGSNSTIAPSIDSLMQAVRAVAAPLNDLLSRFEGVLPENLVIEAGWSEQLDNLDELLPEIRSTPMQAGNEGALPSEAGQSKDVTPGVSFGTVKPPEARPQQQQVSWGQVAGTSAAPASSPAPARGPSGGTDFESLVRAKPALQQAVGWGGSHGWNPGQSWQQAPQRASLSNPSAPVQQSWASGGGNQWGNQAAWGGNQGGGWGQQQQQYRL